MLALKRTDVKIPTAKNMWRETIDIKPLLHSDPANISNEHVAKVANNIAKLLRKSLPEELLSWNSGLHDAEILEITETLEEMEGCSSESLIDCFNETLIRLYAWGDQKRYWLG